MNITIINIGDELLIGQVVNTNASTMSRMLTAAGMDVLKTMVVGDERQAIWKAVDEAMHSSDAVLVTGGLGPTKDDITKKLLCEYFNSELVESAMALDNVRRIFESRGYELTPVNRAQALVPRCCEVLNNDLGTAPCMWFAREGKVLVSLPGVPFEMEWLMRNRVLPKLQETFKTDIIVTKNILTQGIGESFLSDLIEPWELSLPENIKLAYLPVAGLTKLRLTVHGSYDPSILKGLYDLAGQYIVGEDCETYRARSDACHRRKLHWRQHCTPADGPSWCFGLFQRRRGSLQQRSERMRPWRKAHNTRGLWSRERGDSTRDGRGRPPTLGCRPRHRHHRHRRARWRHQGKTRGDGVDCHIPKPNCCNLERIGGSKTSTAPPIKLSQC